MRFTSEPGIQGNEVYKHRNSLCSQTTYMIIIKVINCGDKSSSFHFSFQIKLGNIGNYYSIKSL